MVLHSSKLFYVREGFSMNTRSEQQHIEYLLSREAFDKWLFKHYPISNGDMLLDSYEDMSKTELYLREHGLPLDSEIRGL
jgi:hypothetical protein